MVGYTSHHCLVHNTTHNNWIRGLLNADCFILFWISKKKLEKNNLPPFPPPLLTGICGKPRIADVGGVPYLLPLVQKDKVSKMWPTFATICKGFEI